MWFAALLTILVGASLINAQSLPSVRHITVRAMSSSPAKSFTPIEFAVIVAAWESSRVKLVLEKPLDIASIAKAKVVIRQLYAREGHAVRVEHTVSPIQPRGAEVAFRVVELCTH